MIGVWTALVLIAAGPDPGPAAEPANPPPAAPAPDLTVTTIPLRPAIEPRPSLRYRLTAEPAHRQRTNAAPFLYRALLIQAQQVALNARSGKKEPNVNQSHVRWLDQPIADLPRDQARRFLNEMVAVRREIGLAVECDHADWEFDRSDNGVSFQMPEIQDCRDLGRILALEARLAIAEGRFDDACAALRTQGSLARLVADGPNLIQALVGLSLSHYVADGLRDLAAAPGSPSLFWALAERPRPFIDFRRGMESERLLLDVDVPDLRELDRGPWTVERARRCVDALSHLVQINTPGGSTPGLSPVDVALSSSRIYPEARRALIAEGRPAAEVDAMPVLQVALLATYRDYLDRRDAMFRWAHIPYAQSPGRMNSLREAAQQTRSNPLLAAMATIHAEGLEPAKLAQVRYERLFDAWQVVEAIRLDVTRHDGRLPTSLGAIADLPLPLDPVTGRPFGYRVEGTTAIVSGPAPAGYSGPAYAFEIRLTNPNPAR